MSELKIVIGNSPISPNVEVNRGIIPTCLLTDSFKFQDLQNKGPWMFDIEQITLWLHPDQDNGECKMTGVQILDFLCKKQMIERCLNLQDGLAIKKKGATFFQHYFGDSLVFLFQSVVLKPLQPKKQSESEEQEIAQEPKLEVPYLYLDSSYGILRIGYMLLEEKWKWNYFTPLLSIKV